MLKTFSRRWPVKIFVRLWNPHVQVPSILPRRCISSRPRNKGFIDEETLSDYDSSRYSPIEPGSTLDQSYTVMVKLGNGRTSTTWLCKDHKYVRSKCLKFVYSPRYSPSTEAPTKSSKPAWPTPLAERRRHSRNLHSLPHTQSTAAASACASQKAYSISRPKGKTSMSLCLSPSARTCSSIPISRRNVPLAPGMLV